MIKFETDGGNEGVNVYLDSEGIIELISYLNFIQNQDDHMHLIAGNELSEEQSLEGCTTVKHVKLMFLS